MEERYVDGQREGIVKEIEKRDRDTQRKRLREGQDPVAKGGVTDHEAVSSRIHGPRI